MMTNAPEKIGVWPFSLQALPDGESAWAGGQWGPINGRGAPTMPETTPYIRKDISDARIADIEEQLEKVKAVCWGLFHLGNDGRGLSDAAWTGAKWVDSDELTIAWESARDTLAELEEDK